MAKYQNVGTPRFYVDYFQYALTTGIITDEDFFVNDEALGENKQKILNLFYLNPAKTNLIDDIYFQDLGGLSELNLKINTKFTHTDEVFDYIGILNHNLLEVKPLAAPNFDFRFFDNSTVYDPYTNTSPINLNKEIISNGFTFVDLKSDLSEINIESPEIAFFDFKKLSDKDLNLGCLTGGKYYDMPHSPDLDLTLTREYGGSSKQFTKGGNLLTNYNYTQQPTWGKSEAWGTYTDTPRTVQKRRAGRRRWDLKFSYIASSDLMAEIETLDNDILVDLNLESYLYRSFDGEQTEIEENSLFTKDTSFFTEFMQKTLGGSLRFIFQPDKTDFTPDGFAICVLDQDSISFKQVAHNTYNVSLKILEVW